VLDAAASRAAPPRPAPPPAARPSPPSISSASPLAAQTPVMVTSPPPKIEIDNDRWLDLLMRCSLKGPVQELAVHAAFLGYSDGIVRLILDEELRPAALVKQLAEAISAQLGGSVQLKFETGEPVHIETLHQRAERQRDAKQTAAEDNFMANPDVQRLINQQGAKLVPDSIRPFED
jgi:DNA polymerase III subunit gamma/tau